MKLTLALAFGKRNKKFCAITSQSVGWADGEESDDCLSFSRSRSPFSFFVHRWEEDTRHRAAWSWWGEYASARPFYFFS
jgi:hypothetical protein